MRVAVFHNRYVFRGGEDAVVDLEMELLRKAGHEAYVLHGRRSSLVFIGSYNDRADPRIETDEERYHGMEVAMGPGGRRRRAPTIKLLKPALMYVPK